MKVLEIPAYRKNQLNQNPTAIVNPSPPRISEIPAFKPRKSNDWQPTPIDNSNQEFQQLHLPAAMNSDLVRRLKNSEPTVHRSIDCIVGGNKTDQVTAEPAMKVAPSWTNVAQRSESISSTTGAVQSAGSKKSSIDDETKGKLNSKSTFSKTKFSISAFVQTIWLWLTKIHFLNIFFDWGKLKAIVIIDLCEYHQFYELLGRKNISIKRKRRMSRRRNSDDSHTTLYTKSNRSFVELFCLGRGKGS